MPLSAAEEKELAELEELDRLEKEVGGQLPQPALAQEQVSVPFSRRAEAFLQGAGERATFGGLPRLQAALAGILPEPGADVTQRLREQGFTVEEQPQDFQQRYQQLLARQKALQEEAPIEFGAGQIAGTVAGGIPIARGLGAIPAIASRTGKLATLGRAAGVGAIEGALETPEELPSGEGLIEQLQIPERAKSAGISGALGGAAVSATGALRRAATVVRKAPETLQELANLFALKSAGAMTKELRKEVSRPISQKLGKKILEKNLVQAGDTLEDVLERSSKLREETGKELGLIYKSAKDTLDNPEFVSKLTDKERRLVSKTKLDANQLANQIEEKIIPKFKGVAGGTQAINQLEARAIELRQLGQDPNISRVHEFRRTLDDMIDFTRTNDVPQAEKALKNMRGFLNKKIENRVKAMSAISGKGLGEAKKLKELNKDFSVYAATEDMAKKNLGRVQARLPFGGAIGTVIGSAAGGGALAGGGGKEEAAILGALAALGTGAVRRYGAPVAAKTAQSLSRRAIPIAPIGGAAERRLEALLGRPELLGIGVGGLSGLAQKRLRALEE